MSTAVRFSIRVVAEQGIPLFPKNPVAIRARWDAQVADVLKDRI